MVDFEQIYTAGVSLVGFKEENEILLTDQQKTSTSGFYVNTLPGVDLLSVKKTLVVKQDVTTETVSEYLQRIYNQELHAVIFAFINQKHNAIRAKGIYKEDPLIITPLFTDNMLAFAESFQHQLAIRILSDAFNSKEFNAITELQRNNWRNNAQYLSHKLKGYDFQYNESKAHMKGLLEIAAEYFEGMHETCFPTIQFFF